VRLGFVAAAAISLNFLLFVAGFTQAQTSPPAPTSQASPPPLPPTPLPGFLPPYEITRIVRSAGFDPLAPPLREGTTYVLRATDFRGLLMRVVVDAQSGAIRAVNRIVAGPGAYGPVGMLPPSYDQLPAYGRAPYEPSEFDGAETEPHEESALPPAPVPAAIHPAAHPLVAEPPFPPLPRARPAELAARDAKPVQPVAKPTAAPALTPPPAAPAPPKKPPPIQLPD
jgi:hypothetical protein